MCIENVDVCYFQPRSFYYMMRYLASIPWGGKEAVSGHEFSLGSGVIAKAGGVGVLWTQQELFPRWSMLATPAWDVVK